MFRWRRLLCLLLVLSLLFSLSVGTAEASATGVLTRFNWRSNGCWYWYIHCIRIAHTSLYSCWRYCGLFCRGAFGRFAEHLPELVGIF